MIQKVPTDNRPQPKALRHEAVMHAMPEFCLDRLKLRGKPPLHGGATDHELPFMGDATEMRESEEVKGLWLLPPVTASDVPSCKTTEPYKTRLVGMESQ